MNPLILLLLEKGLEIASAHVPGKAKTAVNTATALTDLVAIALQVYQEQEGKPMDLTTLRPYTPLE